MGQSHQFRATALVVEDDPMQREMLSVLLEESHYEVIECESGEAAEIVLRRNADRIDFLMTDVSLAGNMNGVTLAHIARHCNPRLEVVVTSGRPLPQPLPEGVQYWVKPWAPLDVIRMAERSAIAAQERAAGRRH
jgi:CheY-like chemotaxis protein